jgi:hypothetical protein
MDRREVIARELAGNVNTWRRANKTVRGSLLGKADRILVALGEQAGTADLLQRIVDEHPCEGDYEADARYVWPSRWEALRSALIANLPAALRDPEHPERYDLGPRATDITVIYEAEEDKDSPGDPDDEDSNVKVKRVKVRKKALLSELLAVIPNLFVVSIKVADPRELILKTHRETRDDLELIAKLSGELLAVKTAVQVNVQHNTTVVSTAVQAMIDEIKGK